MRGQACVDHNSLILGLLLKQSTYKKQTMEFGTTTCKAAWSMKEVRIWIQWKRLLPTLPPGSDLHPVPSFPLQSPVLVAPNAVLARQQATPLVLLLCQCCRVPCCMFTKPSVLLADQPLHWPSTHIDSQHNLILVNFKMNTYLITVFVL